MACARYVCHGLVLPEAGYHRYRSNLISSRQNTASSCALASHWSAGLSHVRVRDSDSRIEVDEGTFFAPSSSVDMTINLFLARARGRDSAVGHLARLPNALRLESRRISLVHAFANLRLIDLVFLIVSPRRRRRPTVLICLSSDGAATCECKQTITLDAFLLMLDKCH